jgi:aldehyde dehydrogenase (NAD+)
MAQASTPVNQRRWKAEDAGIPDGTSAWIGDQWRKDAAGPRLAVEDPALAAVVGEVTEAGADLVAEAVDAAVASAWATTQPKERARILAGVAAAIRTEEDTLAAIEAVDTGKPLAQARADVVTAAEYFEYFGALADKLFGQSIPQNGPALAFTAHEPYGVVAHITPWNSPLSQMCRGIAPSLAAGNTVVVKPSEITPYSSLWCGRLFQRAGLPAGACSIVVGRGPSTGEALLKHPAVRHVSFTGSVATGQRILQLAAPGIVPCTLELGGKSPLIVCEDADLDAAAEAGIRAIVRNAGQSCFAPTRLLVDKRVHDSFVERLAARLAPLRLGHPLDGPDVGPLSSGPHLRKVRGYVDSAVAAGARAVTAVDGQSAVDGCPGYFLAPTVLAGMTNDMAAAREEIFGPVQSVLTFGDVDEAVQTANDTPYGLTATVFSRDTSRALGVARRLQAGQVHVNRYPSAGVDVPFGGFKQSGMGREKGWEAMLTYTQTKAFVVATG